MKRTRIHSRFRAAHPALAAALALAFPAAHGFEFDTGNPDVKVRWDNTLKYSNAFRLKSPSSLLLSDPNGDDGDRNFKKGLISNRLDLLSELDVTAGNFGFRMSGAAWYDDVYNRSNDNNAPGTVNHLSRPYNEFTDATRKLQGRKGELLDAFVFGRFDLGEQRATFRLGRHALLWGESLFFGANGIAGGMAPVDIAKAVSVPNTQFKELIRPTGQVSGQVQINPDVSVGAYYQYRWERSRIPGVGSYFETSESAAPGTERYFFGPAYATKGNDIEGRNSGQYGLQLRFRGGETDYGLYAIRYHDKTPQLYFRGLVAGVPSQYFSAYPEDIKAFGASFSRTFGSVNVAGEVSVRHNMPLASDAQVDVAGTGNNRGNALYAVGRTAHAQLSWIANLDPNFISRESSLLGEIAWNRTTSVTRNRAALNPNGDRDAVNIRVAYEPQFRQVFSGVDLSVPVSVGYGFGNSSALGSAFLGDKVGNLSIGIAGNYLQVWRFSLGYTHFFGPEGTFVENRHVSYKQALKDRNFISLSVNRTF
ncbi:DUF1302 domain-containing protein [Paracidovorax wautersii]|uniref:DUF1302 domain-containing protein n=1 Tax=Paracidovorax wautersii TaxID=1177982 RepID=A0A1I2E0M6_9BURK|nr:DUF1302 domain-containing protein [Paracidovorax wautersii]SFE85800.1 Protein of unknown function [Paracidovorax wautersii]